MSLEGGVYLVISTLVTLVAVSIFLKLMKRGGCEGPLKCFCFCLSKSRERQQMCYLYCCFCHIIGSVVGFIFGIVLIILYFTTDSDATDDEN